MKKKLNAHAITNELAGASSYFRRSEKPRPEPVMKTPDANQGVPGPVPPYGVPPPIRPRRSIRQRQPFDVFEDQYRELKQIAEEERGQGLPGSMSRMVREAIDQYLERYKKNP